MIRLGILLMILIVGAVILCPLVMAFEPEPMPWDFVLPWGSQHFAIPLVWSLCASGVVALLYSVFRR